MIYFKNLENNICFGRVKETFHSIVFYASKTYVDRENCDNNLFRAYIFLCLPPYNSIF